MGKKKKTYVKPEMKIIEVKTEGVIAASGEIIIDPEDPIADTLLSPSCSQGGNASILLIGECGDFRINTNGGCSAWTDAKYGSFEKGDKVNICHMEGLDGKDYYRVKKIK